MRIATVFFIMIIFSACTGSREVNMEITRPAVKADNETSLPADTNCIKVSVMKENLSSCINEPGVRSFYLLLAAFTIGALLATALTIFYLNNKIKK